MSILHAILHLQSHVLGFLIQSSLRELQPSIFLHLHQHTNIYYDSFFALNYIKSHLVCMIQTPIIQTWTKNHFVSFTPDVELNTFEVIFFTLFGTQTQAYELSIVLQLPPHLLALPVYGKKDFH